MKNYLTETPAAQMLAEYLKDNKLRCTPERFKILNMIYSIEHSYSFQSDDILRILNNADGGMISVFIFADRAYLFFSKISAD